MGHGWSVYPPPFPFSPLTNTPSDSSSIASETSSLPDTETLSDRLYALKDMVPPTYRKHISTISTQTYNAVSTTLKYGGKTLWVVSTSALLLGVPWALAFGEEQQVMEMEREMRMQQSANEVLVQQQGQGEAKAAL